MTNAKSPQAEEMADESMVRTLAAQAEAIWPQEEPIFARHPLGAGARVLDAGCGTGEVIARLAARFEGASFVGVDLEEPHLERARARCRPFAARTTFEAGDALALSFEDASFDLVLSRHVLQAVPDARAAPSPRCSASSVPAGGFIYSWSRTMWMLWCHPGRSSSLRTRSGSAIRLAYVEGGSRM